MSKVIQDQVDDRNRQEFCALVAVHEPPDFVKQSGNSQVFGPVTGLPATAFADAANRKLPCQTKAACYVSNMFFEANRAEIPSAAAEKIAERLRRFTDHWGIAAEVTEMQAKLAAHRTVCEDSLPDGDFALITKVGDQKIRKYPLRNDLEVKAAADWLIAYRDQMPFSVRHQLANRILDKAAQLNASLGPDVDDTLQKQAGRGVYSPGKVAEMIRDRARLFSAKAGPQVCEGLNKLAEAVESNPLLAEDPANSYGLADTISQLDAANGLVGKYSEKIPRPEDVIFGGTLKAAEEFVQNACCTLTGAVYDKAQFQKLSVAHVRSLLGDEIAEAVTTGLMVDPEKMVALATTLPLPDAAILDRLMGSVGEAPVRKYATAMGMTNEERQKLAQFYSVVQKLPAAEAGELTGMTGSRVIGEARRVAS